MFKDYTERKPAGQLLHLGYRKILRIVSEGEHRKLIVSLALSNERLVIFFC